ncbi:zinc finger CCCH domain-containing protein [Acrasis kona]|uniref:Zinc finger CCCH domain-containing protein n=1 Tax=Acrasis kona TaxID=1008807 RepID=A0AAW2Z8T7_9EUKA
MMEPKDNDHRNKMINTIQKLYPVEIVEEPSLDVEPQVEETNPQETEPESNPETKEQEQPQEKWGDQMADEEGHYSESEEEDQNEEDEQNKSNEQESYPNVYERYPNQFLLEFLMDVRDFNVIVKSSLLEKADKECEFAQNKELDLVRRRQESLQTKMRAEGRSSQELCVFFVQSNSCRNGRDCVFSHSREHSSIPCRLITSNGYCKYGSRCKFSHAVERPQVQHNPYHRHSNEYTRNQVVRVRHPEEDDPDVENQDDDDEGVEDYSYLDQQEYYQDFEVPSYFEPERTEHRAQYQDGDDDDDQLWIYDDDDDEY